MTRTGTTIYRSDYVPKSVKYLKNSFERNKTKNKEFDDPICESFKHYLKLDIGYNAPLEEVDSYFERTKNEYPTLKEITNNKSVNKNVIRKNQIYNGRTVYQVDYSDLEGELAYKEYLRRNAVVLPLNSEIPLTTQRAGFRDPIKLNSQVYNQKPISKPENNLDPNDKIRKILNVTTGDSEYMGYISKLGKQIIEEQLHGIITRDKKN